MFKFKGLFHCKDWDVREKADPVAFCVGAGTLNEVRDTLAKAVGCKREDITIVTMHDISHNY